MDIRTLKNGFEQARVCLNHQVFPSLKSIYDIIEFKIQDVYHVKSQESDLYQRALALFNHLFKAASCLALIKLNSHSWKRIVLCTSAFWIHARSTEESANFKGLYILFGAFALNQGVSAASSLVTLKAFRSISNFAFTILNSAQFALYLYIVDQEQKGEIQRPDGRRLGSKMDGFSKSILDPIKRCYEKVKATSIRVSQAASQFFKRSNPSAPSQ